MLYLIVRSTAFILFKILFRLLVFGRKNIPLKGGVILASNHTSYLDPPILGAVAPRMLMFMAKEELFRNAFFGGFIRRLNAFPVKGQFGNVTFLRRAIKELRRGKALAIFPEGRRTVNGQLDRPMQGVGLLAAKTGACIVPAYIAGSSQALPVHSKFIRLKQIKVYFGKPFFAAELGCQLSSKDSYQAIAARTMEEISRLKKGVDG